MRNQRLTLLVAAALILILASCGGKKAKEEAQEAAATQAGIISKSVLKEELKLETIQLLKDMPESDIPQRIAAGEITIGVGSLSHILPASKAAGLTTASQKARALGIYLSDCSLLKALGQPFAEVEAALTKLASDLDVTFILNQATESPASKEDFRARQEAVINALAEKLDVAIEMLGGIAVENACLYANPTLVVKGDATYVETLSENMLKRFDIIGEIIGDLSAYYPDLKTLGATIAPLREKLTSVNAARAANAEILALREKILE